MTMPSRKGPDAGDCGVSSDAVIGVRGRAFVYSTGFKDEFRRRLTNGESPSVIFADNGLPTSKVGSKRVERATRRWSTPSGLLGPEATWQVNQSRAVESFDGRSIRYDPLFKAEFVERRALGESALSIFESVGLPASLVGRKRIERCDERWWHASTRGKGGDA